MHPAGSLQPAGQFELRSEDSGGQQQDAEAEDNIGDDAFETSHAGHY